MKTISDPAPDATARFLAEEGGMVRGFIASNRSDTLLRLFDFLLEQSIAGRRLKESEIAEEIFPGNSAVSAGQGSQVRVSIYRLRKKLDLYYADKSGVRLVIPQGEYGLLIKPPENRDAETGSAENAPLSRRRLRPMSWVAAALLLAALAAAWFLFEGAIGFGQATVRPTLWQAFESGKKPTVIALGDYFMFIRKQNDHGAEVVVQDLSIDSSDAFYEYVTKTPGLRDSVRNEDLHAVSSDIVGSGGRLWAYLKDFRLVAAASSELDPDTMKRSNIVYVGALDALSPLLRDPLFRASLFSCGATCYELDDKPSGRRFLSDSPYLLDDRIVPRRDYGYIASFPGPSGNRILIVSGTGDAGVAQMVGIVTDGRNLEELRQQTGNSTSFEALYQVRTMFNESYSSALLIARPINAAQIWESSTKEP